MDNHELRQDILDRARASGLILTTAESCTGGMIAVALTDLPGSSAQFEQGFVTYSNQAKIQILGVSALTLDRYGAVSPEVATEMAEGALARSCADIAVAVSGIAGPGGSDLKPEGRVCFALATAEYTHCQTQEFGAAGREIVRLKARDHALWMILKALEKRA